MCIGRGKGFFVFYFGQNVFYHVAIVPNIFLVLGRGRMYFINVVGTCSCHPRQSTPPGVARARDALRDRGREGTIVARGGAAGFGALALVPTVAMISKPETPVRSILRAVESARHDVLCEGPCYVSACAHRGLRRVFCFRPTTAGAAARPSAGCAKRDHRGRLLAAPSPTARSSRRGTCARLNQRPGYGPTPSTMCAALAGNFLFV